MKLENLVGRLSPVQKMLLGTDGSVTSLLEVVTGSPVEIETLVQRVVPADEAVARELQIDPGDEVNYRVVLLKKANSQRGAGICNITDAVKKAGSQHQRRSHAEPTCRLESS